MAERRLPHIRPSRQFHNHIMQLSGQLWPAYGRLGCLFMFTWEFVRRSDPVRMHSMTSLASSISLYDLILVSGSQRYGIFLAKH